MQARSSKDSNLTFTTYAACTYATSKHTAGIYTSVTSKIFVVSRTTVIDIHLHHAAEWRWWA
eukprot:29622-Eustigmatos_ZCMA.PRE.1